MVASRRKNLYFLLKLGIFFDTILFIKYTRMYFTMLNPSPIDTLDDDGDDDDADDVNLLWLLLVQLLM